VRAATIIFSILATSSGFWPAMSVVSPMSAVKS